ncbi:MAG: hypothetical protein QOJ63_2475 [Solirubrobacteraceae bacterium]|jgi:hypothetical protein|nr:hypothetical protein [Solirubrobacteraceae bacterium]
MTTQSPTLMRCERCRAVISTAEATELIRAGVPCGVCGGRLTLCGGRRGARLGGDRDGAEHRPSAERRLLGVLREAAGRPVGPRALTQAGIEDPANTIYELERAGYRIERAYTDASVVPRRFLGYRLGRIAGGSGPC